jgi:signal transduction histidine kinase
MEGQLRNAAAVLATGTLPYTAELLRRLASLQQADFVLLDGAGKVSVTTSDKVGAAIEASLAASQSWANSAIRKLEAPVQSIAVYHTIAASHDPRYSALVAVAPLGDAVAAARRAALWLSLAMLTATAVLGAVVLTLVRSITRPLSQLSALADRIAAGERKQRVELPRRDEIGALADALNTMMLRLSDYESRLTARSRMSALGEMSARLAHEIRNPLTGLKLHLQLLAERIGAQESGRVERLLTEVQRLELLVSSTLLLGGDHPLEAAPTRVEGVIAEVVDLMGPSLVHRGIRVESRCDNGLHAQIDRGRVRQALLNLIVNAADAMPKGGILRLRAEHDSDASSLLILVEDSGPGIPENIRAQLDGTPISTKPFGLGLGMTVCREVAKAHKGELRIERSTELGGARIVMTLSLPAALATAAATGDN